MKGIPLVDFLGWLATAVFAASYFSKRPNVLRGVQALAAALWIGYGVMIHAAPVIAANTIVACLALSSAWWQRDSEGNATSVRPPG